MRYKIKLCIFSIVGLALLATPAAAQGDSAPNTVPLTLMANKEADEMVALMDSLLESYQRQIHYKRISSIPKPEAGRFAANEIPQYSTEVVQQRLKEICSVVQLDYNPITHKFIEAYTLKHRDVVARCLGMQHVFFPMIEQIFEREGVPMEMKYLCIPESAMHTRARSRAAAVGLWQFMIYTGKQYGLRVDSYIDERQDPYKSTLAAARYLKDLYSIYNDWQLVMAAYNCGPGWVNRGIRLTGGKTSFWEIYRYLPYETRGYVPSYIATVYAMHYAKEHNIMPQYADFTYETDSIHISKKEVSLAHIAKVTGTDAEYLQELNPELRLGRVPYSTAPYRVRLPRKAAEFVAQYPDTIYSEKETPRNSTAMLSMAPGYVPANSKVVYHTVRQGQTLGHIAEYYGCSVYNLMDWNNKASTFINIGEVIRVYLPQRAQAKAPMPAVQPTAQTPAPAQTQALASSNKAGNYRLYTVQNGDSIWEIANRNKGVTVDQILQINNLANNAVLRAGQVLRLPPL